jgi:hypothetical protein
MGRLESADSIPSKEAPQSRRAAIIISPETPEKQSKYKKLINTSV